MDVELILYSKICNFMLVKFRKLATFVWGVLSIWCCNGIVFSAFNCDKLLLGASTEYEKGFFKLFKACSRLYFILIVMLSSSLIADGFYPKLVKWKKEKLSKIWAPSRLEWIRYLLELDTSWPNLLMRLWSNKGFSGWKNPDKLIFLIQITQFYLL